MYSLNLDNDNRILSATFSKYADKGLVIVQQLPTGDISNYKYVDGNYIFSPLPKPDDTKKPSQMDKIEAQLTYTAMMTDTLIGGEV